MHAKLSRSFSNTKKIESFKYILIPQFLSSFSDKISRRDKKMGKINYKIIIFVFVSLLVTAYLLNIAASPAVEFNVSLTKTVGMPGDTFNITVNVTNTESSDIKDFTMLVRVPVGWNVTTQPYVTGDIENASNAEYYVP